MTGKYPGNKNVSTTDLILVRIFVKMINALLQNPHLDRENSVCLVYSILDEIKEEWNKNIANMMIEEAYDKVYYT